MAKILIIDDQESMRTIISHMLLDRGHEVLIAEDGEEGLTLFNESPNSFTLVVADVNMPKIDGFELLQKIKTAQPKMPVVLITGMTEEIVKVVSQEEIKPDAIIKKPFIVDEALEIIEKFSKISAN
ncbi:MAG: response regulator [bacterium]|nr:response regulator [Candidatus Margulisiibacteriota bacterium]